MKKLLIVLLLFIFTGCNSDTSIDKEDTLYKGFCSHIKIIRIGNHQYLEYCDSYYRGSICHYEDCDYCKQHRGY